MIQEEAPVKITVNDLIYAQVQDLGKRMDRLENRLDKVETKLEKLNEKIDANHKEVYEKFEKQDEKIDRLADKIDGLRRDLSTGVNHNQVMTGSIVAIALGVVYFVATH